MKAALLAIALTVQGQAERAILCCFLKMDLTDHVILSVNQREQNFRNWKRKLKEQSK